ncbi:MAG: hydroxyisourate hydrolase [Pseudomonadota bacterium]
MNVSISSHVLNLELGKPAAGLEITLSQGEADDFVLLERAVTDGDGRVGRWELVCKAGVTLRMSFATAAWFEANGQSVFYPQVHVDFCPNETGHYHIPLLLNRHGYSTYRGS